MAKSIRENLEECLGALAEERLWEVYDFARYLRWLDGLEKKERVAWHRLSPAQAEQL